jgi:hypothetical protein
MREINPNLVKFTASNEKSRIHEGKSTIFKGRFRQKLRRAASARRKSLQPGAPTRLEIGIRHEEKSALNMRVS